MIAIVDYGLGNLGSILNMFKKVGAEAEVTADRKRILDASKVVLPGVGSFDAGMERLEKSGLRSTLDECSLILQKPTLGICLGMQLMSKKSEEGVRQGLGWVDAEVKRLRQDTPEIKIPHMGWNIVERAKDDPLIAEITDESRFYFVHSYHVKCANSADVLLYTTYGEKFHSAFCVKNIWGVQFHPEKSHKFGMKLFHNFSKLG